VIDQSVVSDPTIYPPGFNLPRHLWSTLYRSQTGKDCCGDNLVRLSSGLGGILHVRRTTTGNGLYCKCTARLHEQVSCRFKVSTASWWSHFVAWHAQRSIRAVGGWLVFNGTFNFQQKQAISSLSCQYKILCRARELDKLTIKWKSAQERRKHCARAGCGKVRTPPARRPPARYTPTDRTDYNTLRRSYSAQCNNETIHQKTAKVISAPRHGLCGDNLLTVKSFPRGVFLAVS